MADPLPRRFFARPAVLVAPDLLGCLLVRRRGDGSLLKGMIVETEAYSQSEPACHGHRRRSPSNETLFGEPGRFYVYVSHGIHHCVNVVTDRREWADGVLLRAASLPGEPERRAAGPGLLARCFGIDRSQDGQPSDSERGLWLAGRPAALGALLAEGGSADAPAVVRTGRIGIRKGRELPWRWYVRASRSVSRRAPGDRPPRHDLLAAWLTAPTVG
jgi:DNA-3-methyladenine glycosylase